MNGIEELLKKYGTSLAETRKLMPELVESIKRERAMRPPPLPTTPQFFTAEEVRGMGLVTEAGEPFELELGWRLKVTPPVDGQEPIISYITPEDWEITQDQMYISPEGERFTREQMEVQWAEAERYRQTVSDYGLLYKEYQRTGGELPIEDWMAIGAPLRPFTEQVFGRVFPEGDIEQLLVSMITEGMPELERLRAEKAQEEFVGAIREIGRTKDTEALLRQLGADTAYIDEFFAPVKPWFERLPPEGIDIIMEIAGVRTSVHVESPNLQVWAKGILIGRFNVKGEFHPTPKGLSEYLKETYIEPPQASKDEIKKAYEARVREIYNSYPKAPYTREQMAEPWYREMMDAKAKAWDDYQQALRPPWERYFTAGMGDVVVAAAGVTRWMGKDGIADKLTKFAGELQAQAPPDYLGEFEWSMMLNPRFYSTRVLRALPFTLSLVPAAIGGAYCGTALAPFVPFLGTYGKLILGSIGAALFSRPLESAFEAGTTYDDAIAKGMTKEQADKAAMDVFLGNMVLGGWDAVQFAIAFIPIPGAPTASRFWKMAMVGGKLTIVGLTEAGEEAYQEVIQRWALDEEVKLDAEMQQVMAIGGIFGIGLGGVGDVFTRIKGQTLENLSPDARATFDGDVTRFEGEGLTREQAELRAFDELAKTEAGGIATSDAIEQIKREGFDSEAARYREIIEAREAPPEVPAVPEVEPPVVPKVPEVPVVKPPIEEVTGRELAMMEVDEMVAELAGLKEWLASEPAAKLVSLIKRTGWRKGEISNLTIPQYKKITGKEMVPPTILTADKKHVHWEYALDDVATEMGYRSGDELREAIGGAGESLARIKALQAEIPLAKAEIEAPIEITPEVEIQKKLTAAQKIQRQYQERIKGYEQTKKALVSYINKNLPLAVRGKMLAAVKNVKTELGLTRAINRVNNLAEQDAQKTLLAEIRKEIKSARAVIRNKIIRGKFTPDTQRRLDILRHNLELDRDQAREKIANNINQYDEGKLSYEEMLEANEALNFAGIKGMSSEELAETLDYIRSLKEIGRSERQAKAERATERIQAIREDIIGILTDGKGLKPGIGTVSARELEVTKTWLEKLVNWQYSWDNFMDKLSKFDKTSKPYQSKISVFGKEVHFARSQENVGSRVATGNIRENFSRIFETTRGSEINQILNRFQETKINLGSFKNLDGVEVTLQLTKDQIISKYQQLQDPTLEATFTEAMRWTDEIKQAIQNNLSDQERAWADWQMEFYQEYYEGVNKVYAEIYGVDLPHNLHYSPIKRDLEAEIRENVLTFQDAGRYASVLNGSLKSRVTNKIPLRFNGSTGILINHIGQMEHFKAWAETMRDMRRVFGNKEVRTAIRQYHGAPILKTVDGYLNDMARGGVERALINRGADFLRRNFARSILSIKPVIGLKQVPSVLAYTTEMPIGDFVTGIADFWSHPIANYRFLIEHSSYARARFAMGFERDIRFAMRRTPVGQISGKTSVVNWFMLQIRLGDKLAATQGMWAKYKSVMKGKEATAENIDMAMREAQISTDRTQPSFDLETLSPLQKGGSWVRLLTMFQNQPNKYFRIMADNARNFEYGRGSRAVAVRNILLVWVILPCLFQFIADAFQLKPERQLRAIILGPLNWLLIFGQFAQSAYGWVTDEPFDYQASPVMQSGRDIQTAVQKVMKLIKQGKDPYQNISVDDAIAAAEYFAKAAGELLGYPTPWLVQAERGIRTAITEDEPERYLELAFSRWALEPPRKGANEKVEELLDSLGLPIEEKVEKPLTGEPEEIYDMADLNSDINRILGHTIPSEITAEKGFNPLAVAWALKEQARSIADTLPNIPLYKINADTEQDDTILQYYKQWKAREGIDNLADLREFDKLYPKAYLGNVTRQQYSLLVKYLETEDKDAFLEKHPELRVNPRTEWLKAHPKENAQLALWGQAKILSTEAYTEFNRLVKELDIPDDAIPEQTLPPEGSVENYFKYLETGEDLGYNSWEVQLLLTQDDELRTFLDRQPIDTPVESLELKVKHRDLFEEYDLLETDEDRKALKEANPEWVDDMRRIEAIEHEADDSTIESWVERGKLVDEFTAGSSEAKVWLLDNPEVHKWALDQELLTDDGSDWNEPILRINVKWRELDDQYKGFGDKESEFYIEDDDERAVAREKLLADNEAYRKDCKRRDAYGDEFPEGQIENYVAYYELSTKGYRQERMLIENAAFGKAMHEIAGIDLPDPKKIPAVGYDETYEKWQADFEKLEGLADHESEYYIEDINRRAAARYNMRYDARGNPTEFGKAEKRLDAYTLFVPEDLIPTFVEWYTSPGLKRPDDWEYDYWFEDDWFLMEHPKFYQTMLDLKIWLEPTDLSKVPTREVFNLYKTYVGIPQGAPQLNYRARFPELDAWGVIAFGWKPIGQRGKKEPPKTPWEEAEEVKRFKELF